MLEAAGEREEDGELRVEGVEGRGSLALLALTSSARGPGEGESGGAEPGIVVVANPAMLCRHLVIYRRCPGADIPAPCCVGNRVLCGRRLVLDGGMDRHVRKKWRRWRLTGRSTALQRKLAARKGSPARYLSPLRQPDTRPKFAWRAEISSANEPFWPPNDSSSPHPALT